MDLTFYDNGASSGIAVQMYTSAGTPVTIFNEGTPVINASIDTVRVETLSNFQSSATTTLTLLSAAGNDSTIFDEINGLSNGTLDLLLESFDALNSPGVFTADGSIHIAQEPGDLDNDGDVDGTDFLEWQRSLGTIYDATDLSIWETNFGNAPLAATVSIPEPTTLTLSTLALLGMGYRRRRWG